MTNVRIERRGFDELRADFRALRETVQARVMRKALRAGGEVVAEEARRLAPYDPAPDNRGLHLRDEIRVVTRLTDLEASASIGFTRPVFYGQFAELGTSRQPPRPFLRPAIEAKQGEAVSRIREVLAEEIERAVRRGRNLR